MVEEITLLFKEQWWGISTLTSLKDQALKDEIKILEDHVNKRCHQASLDLLSKKFVPDENVRNLIIKIAHNVQLSAQWQNYVDDFNYVHDNKILNKLGYIILRMQLKPNEQNDLHIKDIRPELLQQVIFLVWYDLIKTFKDKFLFDEKTVPYAITVCSGLQGSTEIEWYKDTILQNKQEIGKWVELYSGQFPDYHDELYENRVQTNLSNRTSEMHFINRNSGMIYMKPENYNAYFIVDERTPNSTGYMYDVVIKTVFQLRSIGFAMVLVTNEIDIDTQQLTTKEFIEKKPALIKADLEKTNRLKMILQKTLAPIFTDLTRSHRQHYHTLLKHCFEINDFEKNWDMILKKIEGNSDELNSIFLDKQDAANKRQEKILGIVNVILGASIVFEIIGYIIKDEGTKNSVLGIVGGIFLVILIGLLGTLYIPKLFKKKKSKETPKK